MDAHSLHDIIQPPLFLSKLITYSIEFNTNYCLTRFEFFKQINSLSFYAFVSMKSIRSFQLIDEMVHALFQIETSYPSQGVAKRTVDRSQYLEWLNYRQWPGLPGVPRCQCLQADGNR